MTLEEIFGKNTYNPNNTKSLEDIFGGGVGEFQKVPIVEAVTPQETDMFGRPTEKTGLLRNLGRSLVGGVTGFGQSIAGAIQPFTPSQRKLEESQQGLLDQQTDIIQKIQTAKKQGEDTTGLYKALTTNLNSILESPLAEEINPALGKTNREIIGEAIETLALTTSGGLLGGRLLLTSAGVGGAYGAAGELRGEETPSVAGVGKGLVTGAVLGLGTAKVGQYIASRLPKLLAIVTGEPVDAIQSALKNPKVADTAIKNGDIALRTAVQKAGNNSIKIRDAFNKGHQEAFSLLVGKNSNLKIQPQIIKNTFSKILKEKEKGVKIIDGVLDFSVSKIKAQPGEVGKIKNVWEAICNWDDFSLSGVTNLKQLVGQLTGFVDEAGRSAKSPTLSAYYGQITEIIKKNLPKASRVAYEEMNKKYTQNIGLYDDMVKAFNSGDPFTRLAGSFGKNKDSLRQIIRFYEEKSGDSLMSVVGGRELALEKQAAFGFLNPRSWIDFFYSPQLQAKTITSVGRTQEVLRQAREVLRTPIKPPFIK
jgi:hypothetical protein